MTKAIVAAVQAAPVFLDLQATVDKACGLIEKAGAEGATLVAFPEAFVPGYPDWVWRTKPFQGHQVALQRKLYENSIVVGDEATQQVADAARRAGTYVALGCDERDETGGTVYNTLLFFSPDGEVLGRHRKLMPTGGEKLAWGFGDASTIRTYDAPFGRIGGLICWENYMPLARAALYGRGVDVYLAPTWDNMDTWVPTLRHIAKEGRCYVVGVTQCFRATDLPSDVPGRDEVWSADDRMSEGNTCIVAPGGDVLAGPLVGEEGILYAEVDAAEARASRAMFDPVGHYARPDVLRLVVDAQAKTAVTYE